MIISRLTLALACALSLTFVISAQNKSDLGSEMLAGKVKSVVNSSYSIYGIDDGPGKRSIKKGDTVLYDPAGNEKERVFASDYGFIMGKTVYFRDRNAMRSRAENFDEKGKLQSKDTFVYKAGKLVETRTFDSKGTLRLTTTREYGQDGSLAQETYSEAGVVRAKTVYGYDGHRGPSELTFFLADGSKAIAPVGPCLGGHRVVFTYNAASQPLTRTIYDANGKVKKAWDYAYNSRGLYEQYSVTSPTSSKVTHTFTYEYDAAGNWIKQTITSVSDNKMAALFERMGSTKGEKVTPEDTARLTQLDTRVTVNIREITYYN